MIYLVIWILFAVVSAMILSPSGRAGAGFALGFLLGPFGLIIAIIIRANQPAQPVVVTAAPPPSNHIGERKCPACAEWIKAEAIKCRFCGEQFAALPAQPPAELNDTCGECGFVYTPELARCPRCSSTLKTVSLLERMRSAPPPRVR